LQLEKPEGGNTGVGVQIVNAPAADPNAVVKAVGPASTAIPAAEKPTEAPDQVNDVKPGSTPATAANPADAKKHKADLNDESSSKKKKKKGLSKLNPL
jgi:outer membrane protein assembly factor BamD